MRKPFFMGLLILLLASTPAWGQATDSSAVTTETPNVVAPPFQPRFSIFVGPAGVIDTSANLLRGWEGGMGVQGGARLLLRRVQAEGGMLRHSFVSRNDEIPDFTTLLVYVGGGYIVSFTDEVNLHVGARVGNVRMSFDEATEFAGVRTESELTFSPYVRGWFAVNRTMSLFGEVSWSRVYTADRFHMGFFTLGLSYAFVAPDWAISFLQ